MKHFRRLIIPIITLFAFACSTNDPQDFDHEIKLIRERHIPDQRLMYWDIHTTTLNDKLVLKGATVSEAAYIELEKMAQQNRLDFQLELLPQKKFIENPWALVTLSVCNIRAEGTHPSELSTQALLGTPVKVYKEEDGWYLVQTPDHYFGWVDRAAISLKSKEELALWKQQEKVIYTKQSGTGFVSANLEKPELDLVMGDLLNVLTSTSNSYEIILPDDRKAFVKKEECSSLGVWKQKQIDLKELISTAFVCKGTPYLWGGTSPKMFDCSGFTKTVFYRQGLILQRDASQQTLYGELVDTSEGYDKLQPGDLLFFGRKEAPDYAEKVTHAGLYIGNKKFIHSSGKVRVNSLDPLSEDYAEYYEKAFVRARRIIGHADGKGIEWIYDNEFYKQILSE